MATTPSDRLARYRAKRDFGVTAEPSGDRPPGTPPPEDGHRFVVQRHRASRLHYDVRLEMGGVLVSWAVPRGPTLDPDVRRLAVHVEDHPLDYFDFEGTIPAGEYGGGDVIVWDWGTWSLAKGDDPLAAVESGELHVDLVGERLVGRFVLIRTKQDWLLLHKHDDHAVPGWDAEDHPTSVKSGRTNDEVRAGPDDVWDPHAPTRPVVPSWDPPTDDELAALDALGATGEWELQGHRLRLTNLDKELFPGRAGEPPVTKRELVRYHARVAPSLLPYLHDRAVNTLRHPDGAATKGFWHKERPSHAPDWVMGWTYPDAGPDETQTYVVADTPATLAWLANFAALELNPWTSPTTAHRCPTWALIDLDPGTSSTFDDVITLARLHKVALDQVGVEAGAKVTGKRGIQIWIPIAPGPTFDETRAWVETISRAVGKVVPDLVSWAWTKRDRGGRARLDYTQNAVNKTLVAPFSTRPAPGAPVSVPITWDELDDPDLAPDRWTVRTVLDRLDEVGDPLRDLVGLPQTLPDL
ncbi:ATP-dependent DNA ligase [Iamia sp. SCSIO 61187]|uniref:non-homologous end-joining DNA ligase LigD n=1 Tax=Iamia sp. SCSIO 61187 TaxID=2722752 RepID=UPI001C63347A|nr:DNA polymerase ligase N-terminal domain-containing protein [Iamia sp. SCSIO 61187]QYG92288.1 ATP-dependent DNA ligase [Iamia sp. SCSIO 61187]